MERPPGHMAIVRVLTDNEDVDDVALKIELLLKEEPTFLEVSVEGFLE